MTIIVSYHSRVRSALRARPRERAEFVIAYEEVSARGRDGAKFVQVIAGISGGKLVQERNGILNLLGE